MDTSSVLLIGEAIAGGIGGWITGGSLKSMSLGQVANTIVGLLGGIVLGYWLRDVSGPYQFGQQRLSGWHCRSDRQCVRGRWSSHRYLRAG